MQNHIELKDTRFKSNSSAVSKMDKIIFIIVALDTLFFPYIRFLSVSLSMIILPLWFLFNARKVKITKEFGLFILLALLVTLSVIFSFVFFPEGSFLNTNIRNSVILIYGFVFYFFYRFFFNNTRFSLTRILNTYVIFGFVLAVIYLINPATYFIVRSFWTLSGNVIQITDGLSIHRFTSTFNDPNTASIAFAAVLAFLLFNSEQSVGKNFLMTVMTGVIIAVTMSSTGFVLYGAILIVLVLQRVISEQFLRFKKSTIIYIILLLIISPLIYYAIQSFISSPTVQIALDRVDDNTMQYRYDIWSTLLSSENIFKYILFGTGGTVLISGLEFAPHNGHLHMIYSYGMIAYLIFMIIFFRKRKGSTWTSYLFILIILAGFTINVAIYEIRFLGLIALLIGAYASMSYRKLNTKD